MSVSITEKNPDQVLGAFDVKESLINDLSLNNISVHLSPTGISLMYNNLPAETVTIKKGAIAMALKGKLGPASKAAITHKLQKAIITVLSLVDDEAEPKLVAVDFAEAEKKVAAQITASQMAPAELKAELAKQEKVDTVTKAKTPSKPSKAKKTKTPIPTLISEVDDLLNETPVPLKDASKLYQPVKGTSPSAKYFTVAMLPEFNIAARYISNTLSLRAEGDIEPYKHNLEKAGFGLSNFSKGYVSVHMDISDETLAAKTLGAVIAGMGLNILTPVPNLLAIENKGA